MRDTIFTSVICALLCLPTDWTLRRLVKSSCLRWRPESAGLYSSLVVMAVVAIIYVPLVRADVMPGHNLGYLIGLTVGLLISQIIWGDPSNWQK
jgi:hypothetical protein